MANSKPAVPASNATQQLAAITALLNKQKLGAITKWDLARSIRKIAKNSAATPVAVTRALGNTATGIVAQAAGTKIIENTQNAKAVSDSAGKAYENALSKWNNIINQNPSNPYTKGEEGQTYGDNTTGWSSGSALGG